MEQYNGLRVDTLEFLLKQMEDRIIARLIEYLAEALSKRKQKAQQ